MLERRPHLDQADASPPFDRDDARENTTSTANYTTATDAISALSATSITVGSLTCSIGSSSPKAGDFKVGDRARIYCANGVLVYLIRPDAPSTTTTTPTTSPTATPPVTTDHHDDVTTRLGTISALSSTSITVDGLTCSVGTSSPSVSPFKVGDQVGIGCSNGVLARSGRRRSTRGFNVVVQLGSIVALSTDSITVGKVTCSLAVTSPGSLPSRSAIASVLVAPRDPVHDRRSASTSDVPKTRSAAHVQRFNGCIKHGSEHCTVKDLRLVHK